MDGHETRTTRLMGALFGLGAVCFVVGPLGAYSSRVSARTDALTFLVGSILFTGGGLTQAWLAHPERHAHRAGRLAWRGAWIQAAGTLLFNLMTAEALGHATSSGTYDSHVWSANVVGSVCFLVSGVLLYVSAPKRTRHPRHHAPGWWEPGVNLLGCVLFGVSAVTGYATSSGHLVDLGVSNWTTTLGAVCFLAVALPPLIPAMSFKVPRLSRLVAFERTLGHEVEAVETRLEVDLRAVGREITAD